MEAEAPRRRCVLWRFSMHMRLVATHTKYGAYMRPRVVVLQLRERLEQRAVARLRHVFTQVARTKYVVVRPQRLRRVRTVIDEVRRMPRRRAVWRG